MRGRSHRADVYGRAKRSTNRLDSKDGKSNPEVSGHCLHLLASPKANGDTGTVLGGGGGEQGSAQNEAESGGFRGGGCGGKCSFQNLHSSWLGFVCFCIVKVVMKQDCSALGRCYLGSDWPFCGATGSRGAGRSLSEMLCW